jgi:hypothetical protein
MKMEPLPPDVPILTGMASDPTPEQIVKMKMALIMHPGVDDYTRVHHMRSMVFCGHIEELRTAMEHNPTWSLLQLGNKYESDDPDDEQIHSVSLLSASFDSMPRNRLRTVQILMEAIAKSVSKIQLALAARAGMHSLAENSYDYEDYNQDDVTIFRMLLEATSGLQLQFSNVAESIALCNNVLLKRAFIETVPVQDDVVATFFMYLTATKEWDPWNNDVIEETARLLLDKRPVAAIIHCCQDTGFHDHALFAPALQWCTKDMARAIIRGLSVADTLRVHETLLVLHHFGIPRGLHNVILAQII